MSIEKRLEQRIKELLGENVNVVFDDVRKNNSLVLRAVIIGVGNIQPTIYIDEALKAIENEETTIEKVADWIVDVYNDSNRNMSQIKEKVDGINKDMILQLVEYQMINFENNKDSLQELPYTKFLDMACIYRCMLSSDMSFIVNRSMMKGCDISFEELDKAARENTLNSGFVVESINNIIPLGEAMDDKKGLWVLSNERGTFGASIMLYPAYFEALANKLQSDLYILPSSIHEVLAISVNEMDKDSLAETVKNVNQEVEEQEILGDKIYRYSLETKELSIA